MLSDRAHSERHCRHSHVNGLEQVCFSMSNVVVVFFKKNTTFSYRRWRSCSPANRAPQQSVFQWYVYFNALFCIFQTYWRPAADRETLVDETKRLTDQTIRAFKVAPDGYVVINVDAQGSCWSFVGIVVLLIVGRLLCCFKCA